MTTFCWLPPDRLLTGVSPIGPDLMRSAAAMSPALVGRRVSSMMPSFVRPNRASEASAMLSATGTFMSRPSSRRFSVRKAMRAAMARRGVIPAAGLPPMTSSPAVEGIEAENDAGELGAARAHQPEEADDLARRHLEVDAANHAPSGQGAGLHEDLVAAGTSARRVKLVDVASEHQVDHAGDRELRRGAGCDQAAVAQDRNVVGQRLHVAEDVRDVDDSRAAARAAWR